MRPTLVMLSHHSRAETARVDSIRGLHHAGVKPRILESTTTTPSDAEVRRLAWFVAKKAEGNPDGLIFMEDDLVVLHPDRLKAFLVAPRPRYELVTLTLLRKELLGNYAGDPNGVQPLDMSLFSADRGFHGSMFMWLSAELVTRILSKPEEFMTDDGTRLTDPVTPSEVRRGRVCGFDFWLKDNVWSAASMEPNPVTHGNYPSTIRR